MGGLARVAGPLQAADASSAGDPAPPKTYVLYLGTDVELVQDDKPVRVQGVDRRAFIVNNGGHPEKVPMKNSAGRIKLSPRLKLSESTVELTSLRVDRAYSLGNEPMQRMAAAGSQAAAANQVDTAGIANAHAVGLQNMAEQVRLAGGIFEANASPNPELAYDAVTAIVQAGSTLHPLERGTSVQQVQQIAASYTGVVVSDSDFNTPGRNAQRLSNLVAADQFDAIELSFNLSSDRPVVDPYVVVTAQIVMPGDKPNEFRTWVYATEIKPIGSDTLHVRIKEAGLPVGYNFRNFQVHLYSRGQELGTTVAENRVELSLDEAFEYLMIDYLMENKGRTVVATPALGRLPAATRQQLQGGDFFVQVSKDGLATGTFSDARCQERVDNPALEAALRTMRFKPALEKGVPIDGVVRLQR